MWAARTVYGLDIETDTTPETEQELAAGYAPGNRGLDPRIGRVVNAAIAHDGGVEVFRDVVEADLLEHVDGWFAAAEPGLIATWNGAVFDMPFLYSRHRQTVGSRFGMVLVDDPDITPKYGPLPGFTGGTRVSWASAGEIPHAHLDVAYALQGKAADLGVKWSLKPVAKALGIDMIEVARDRIHELGPAEQDAYVASDAIGTRELAIRLLTARL